MTVDAFAHLLAPGSIGSLRLPNRVILPGMDTNRCLDGALTTDEISHYAARAAGGCALVITGAAAIAWPVGATSRKQPALSDDAFLPGLTALADAVHAKGGRLCVQLVHHGKVASIDTAEGRPQLVPSEPVDRLDLRALVDNSMDELIKMAAATDGQQATYRVAALDDIAWAVDRFAEAADRVQRAGADAVEVHGAHGYLISTFLSRAYNRRADAYGGSLENRSRILVEVVTAVRDRVGADFPILVRLNGCEYGIPDGITPEEAAATAQLAQAAGADAIHVSAHAANPFRDFTLAPLPAEVGQYRQMAATVKRAVDIPVIAVGRLLPELAEEMLANGECDFVAMGRQQLADPQLVRKLTTGRRRSIRPCINCYVCVEQNFFDASAICAVNPALGDEDAAAAQETIAARVRRIVVVGGGPAGLETARIAAQRGHSVTLLERNDRLGGATWFATLSRSPNSALIDWLAAEVERLGVDVRLGHVATLHSVRELAPDAVVVATGAKRMVTAADLPHPGTTSSVTIIGGDVIGLSLATFLANEGHQVTVREPSNQLGAHMAMPRRWSAVVAAEQLNVTLVRVAGDDARREHVIVTNQARADTTFADSLRAAGLEVHVAGDAGGLGYIHGAMHDAHSIAVGL